MQIKIPVSESGELSLALERAEQLATAVRDNPNDECSVNKLLFQIQHIAHFVVCCDIRIEQPRIP